MSKNKNSNHSSKHPSKHLFFDLDNTLWDFRKNAEEALDKTAARLELFKEETGGLKALNEFKACFWTFNNYLWHQFDLGNVNKEVIHDYRFRLIWQHLGWTDFEESLKFSETYLEICPQGKHVLPGAHKVLDQLNIKHQLHIITNGFDESQQKKLASAGLDGYFDVIVTSDSIGKRKPNLEVFEFAMDSAGTSPKDSYMIGDSATADILPANEIGIKSIWFNPLEKHSHIIPDYEIKELEEILGLLY